MTAAEDNHTISPTGSSTLFNVFWTPRPAGHGGYSYIFKGQWKKQEIALKQLKPCMRDPSKALKVRFSPPYPRLPKPNRRPQRFYRETQIWRNQSHKNVLPFLGVFSDPSSGCMFMISPWRSNGHLSEFLDSHPDVDRPALVRK